MQSLAKIGTVLLVLGVAFVLVSCGTTRPIKEKGGREAVEETISPPRGLVEDFDPLSLRDDDFVIVGAKKADVRASESRSSTGVRRPSGPSRTSSREGKRVQGYRVQLVAIADEKRAMEVKREAMLKFVENVYVVFDSPLYKIRVGDCLTRREAEKLRKKAVQLGFRDAWIVRDMINRKP